MRVGMDSSFRVGWVVWGEGKETERHQMAQDALSGTVDHLAALNDGNGSRVPHAEGVRRPG